MGVLTGRGRLRPRHPSARGLPPGWRLALIGACAAVTALAALVPSPLRGPIGRLANYSADSAAPLYNAPVDHAALRRAAALLPGGTTYYIYAQDVQLMYHDLPGAAYLLFTPSLPVRRPGLARWILSYRAQTLLPPGLRPARVYRLAAGIFLVEVRRP